jgi:hypothetical protein
MRRLAQNIVLRSTRLFAHKTQGFALRCASPRGSTPPQTEQWLGPNPGGGTREALRSLNGSGNPGACHIDILSAARVYCPRVLKGGCLHGTDRLDARTDFFSRN